MNYDKFRECISDTIADYREFLLIDFKLHPEIEMLASKICFNGSITIKEWIYRLAASDFDDSKYTGDRTIKIETLPFKEMDSIDYKFRYIDPNSYSQWFFFRKYEFHSYEEVVKNYPGYFYLCDAKFVKKLDDLVTEKLNGYTKSGKYIFSKKLGSDIILKVEARVDRKPFETIEDYSFPRFYLEYKNTKYFFGLGFDLFSFFFVGTNSYLRFFYMNRNLSKRTDEPVVYVEDEKYVLTNSIENLARFNKFIFLNAELFIHFYRIFEKWVEQIFVPQWLKMQVETT